MIPPDNQLPLSLQIYKAHTDWNNLRHDFDLLDGMRDVLRAQKVLEAHNDGEISISKAETLVKASEWYADYIRQCTFAKRKMLDAQAKHAYLVNLALEQREDGFNERFAAKL